MSSGQGPVPTIAEKLSARADVLVQAPLGSAAGAAPLHADSCREVPGGWPSVPAKHPGGRAPAHARKHSSRKAVV